MSSDLELAELLGSAPHSRDPGFRFDVFARIAERSNRRSARRRAVACVLTSAAIGLAFPALAALGFTLADAEPWLMVAAAMSIAYVLALLTLEGVGGVVARVRLLQATLVRSQL